EDEIRRDDRGRPLAVGDDERLRDERLANPLRAAAARRPAADRQPERRRDVHTCCAGEERHRSSATSIGRAITATLSPCSVVAIARTAKTIPSVSACTTAGSRSGRSRKWICPTASPADTAS